MGRTAGEKERKKRKKRTGEERKEWKVRGVSAFHTLWIKLEASEIDINFNREIPPGRSWGSATAVGWHTGRSAWAGEEGGLERRGRGGECVDGGSR